MRMFAALVWLLATCCPSVPPPRPVAVVPSTPQPPQPPPATPAAPAPAGPPVARTVDVVDRQLGLEIADPYRWMETGGDELTAWMRAQSDHARAHLATLPHRDELDARLHELGLGVTAVFDVELGGDRLFYKELRAGEQLAKLVVRDPDGHDRVLVDPATQSIAGTHTALHEYTASPDGKLVSYVISTGGSEAGVLHVMDVATGKDLPDQIERIWGERAASWLPDGKGFFYTQLAVSRPGVDPMLDQVARLHRLGEPVDKDVTILGHDPGATFKLAAEEWPGLWAPPGTSWVLVFVGGAHSESRVAIAKLSELDLRGTLKTPWRIVAEYADGVENAVVHGDRLYMRTYKNAPNRRLISVPLSAPAVANARVEITEDHDATLTGVWSARDAMYLLMRVQGRARVLRWPWAPGKAPLPIAMPYDGWSPDLASDLMRDGLVFQVERWTHPGEYFRYDAKTRKVAPIGLASTSTADTSSVVAEEVEAINPDGTHVPLSILHAKDYVRDGSHPTQLYAYGAYGSSESPGFSATRLAWIERGGVYAIAHVRGGGENGRKWQDDGSREHKLNGVRDLIACAEYVIAENITSPSRLVVQGASMGGLLVGRTITERPDLFAAANIGVGIVNPLRILHADNGANQKAELGDPETESGYRSIAEMDPYVHVKPSTAYPAVLFTIGLNDRRVAPWMTAKMAARLQASTTSGRPIWIRTDADAGHGIGSTRDQAFAERADVLAFYFAAVSPSASSQRVENSK